MPENIGYQFNRLYAAPIETYRQVNTITNRNAIPAEIRWRGMQVHVVSENMTYELVGGIENSNWINAGETPSNPITHFKGFFNATTVTPAISNLNGIEGDEYKVTNGGVNVDFGAGDVFLETDDILIFYQSQWRVKVRAGGDLDDYQLLSEKGEANGYTPLDSGAKVPIGFLPDSVVGQVEYQGAWNASTNTPNVGDATTKKGHYYVTSVAGTYLGISYEVGDWIISNGVEWQKVDNTDAVVSVFGRIGAVVANSSDYSAYYSPIITGAASSVVTANLAASRAVISTGAGKIVASSVTNIELGYLSGVTSSVQTQLDAAARPYKVYTALLSQSGTGDPTATVLENTLGGTITWARTGIGEYSGTLSISGFTVNKTIPILDLNDASGGRDSQIIRSTSTVVNIATTNGGLRADSLLNTWTLVEIRVYT